MRSVPYILARTMKEAHDFARGPLGLVHGEYRVLTHASTVKSVRNAELHLVPGWENRFDRFAMKGALRWTRMVVIDHSDDEIPVAEPEGPTEEEIAEFTAFLTREADDMVAEGGPDWFRETPEALAALDQERASVEQPEAASTEPPDPTEDDLEVDIPAAVQALAEVNPGLATAIADANPDTNKPGRRRSRCKDCGSLHYKGDPCPTSAESV